MNNNILVEYNSKEQVVHLQDDDNILLRHKSTSIGLSTEWLTMSFVAVYILKPFTDKFFEKAGESFYALLKDTISSFKDRESVEGVKLVLRNDPYTFEFMIDSANLSNLDIMKEMFKDDEFRTKMHDTLLESKNSKVVVNIIDGDCNYKDLIS